MLGSHVFHLLLPLADYRKLYVHGIFNTLTSAMTCVALLQDVELLDDEPDVIRTRHGRPSKKAGKREGARTHAAALKSSHGSVQFGCLYGSACISARTRCSHPLSCESTQYAGLFLPLMLRQLAETIAELLPDVRSQQAAGGGAAAGGAADRAPQAAAARPGRAHC
jgi:hypothetical protein